MAALTWRNVDAPNFSGVGDSLRTAASLMNNATSGFSDALGAFDKSSKSNADDAIINRALAITDPAEFNQALNSGAFSGGGTRANEFLARRNSELLGNTSAGLKNDYQQLYNQDAQFRFGNAKVDRSREDAYLAATPAANRLVNEITGLMNSTNPADQERGRALMADPKNADMLSAAGFGTKDIVNLNDTNVTRATQGNALAINNASTFDTLKTRDQRIAAQGAVTGAIKRGTLKAARAELDKIEDPLVRRAALADVEANKDTYFRAPSSRQIASTSLRQASTQGQQNQGQGPTNASKGGQHYDNFMSGIRGGYTDSKGRIHNGVTNPFGLAAIAATGKAESGFSGSNLGRDWEDKSERGAPGRSGGAFSWRNERLANLRAFAGRAGEKGNGSAKTQAQFFLQENPGLSDRLNNAKSVEEAMDIMNANIQFAGWNRPSAERAQRLASAKSMLGDFQNGNNGWSGDTPSQAGGSGPSNAPLDNAAAGGMAPPTGGIDRPGASNTPNNLEAPDDTAAPTQLINGAASNTAGNNTTNSSGNTDESFSSTPPVETTSGGGGAIDRVLTGSVGGGVDGSAPVSVEAGAEVMRQAGGGGGITLANQGVNSNAIAAAANRQYQTDNVFDQNAANVTAARNSNRDLDTGTVAGRLINGAATADGKTAGGPLAGRNQRDVEDAINWVKDRYGVNSEAAGAIVAQSGGGDNRNLWEWMAPEFLGGRRDTGINPERLRSEANATFGREGLSTSDRAAGLNGQMTVQDNKDTAQRQIIIAANNVAEITAEIQQVQAALANATTQDQVVDLREQLNALQQELAMWNKQLETTAGTKLTTPNSFGGERSSPEQLANGGRTTGGYIAGAIASNPMEMLRSVATPVGLIQSYENRR